MELVGQLSAGERLARDEQHGVLAGDRPGDVRMAGDVDRLRQRARIPVGRRQHDEVAARLHRQRPPRQRLRELFAVTTVLGEVVAEPSARDAHLDQPELVHVARDRRLHDLVTFAAKRVRELGLRREGLLTDEPENRGMALVAVHAFNTSVRISRARSTSAAPTTSGGASRSTFAPDVSVTRPASSAASTTGRAGMSSPAPARSPRPRTSTTWVSPPRPARSRSPFARTSASSSSPTVSQTATAAAHATGLPPKVEP